MNHIYRSLWNEKTGTFVAVSEITKCGKKASTGGGVVGAVFALKALAASLLLAFGSTSYALPTDGVVTAGSATVTNSGANSMTINQTSQNAALNWQQFNIGQGEAVRFVQPNSSAVALNRVLGADPSSILGSLSANGKVFLVNPNGILFGAGASVNVGGLVASTRNISDSDFMAGHYQFAGSGSGAVVNQGSINADGGYVALLGANVSNQGVIAAKMGTVALAAGNAVTLDVAGDGLLNVTVDQGAVNALVNNGGMIQADGGHVLLSAQAAGDLLHTVVNNTGVIQAQTIENHNGVIKLLGDMQSGTVNVGGRLDASAPTGGNGGFIETSAAHVKIAADTRVTTAAAQGLTGSWLIDPTDYTIAASGGDITGAQLSANLAGTNITIQSTSGGSGSAGDVNVNDAVSWSANKLTLNAQNNININANLNASSTASLALEFGQGAVAAGNTSNVITHNGASVNLPAGTTNFTTKQGSDGAVKAYTVITSLGAEGSTTGTDLQGMNGNLAANYALGANIDTTSSGVASWNGGHGFSPIGVFPNAQFTGSFDGLGHTITLVNNFINDAGSNKIGLFAWSNATIRNVGLIGGSIIGTDTSGGLVGINYGAISNSYVTTDISGGNSVGGLIGYNRNGGSISNSYATGSVSGTNNVGGLIGENYISAISNSYATGHVTGSGNVGGLVGRNYGGTISNSYATGQLSGAVDNIGGLVGINEGTGNAVTSIAGSYATGSVTGANYVGGLVGKNVASAGSFGYGSAGSSGANSTISNSYATGAVSGTNNIGGLVGGNIGGAGGNGQADFLSNPGIGGAGGSTTITNSYATGEVSGNSNVGGLVGINSNGTTGASIGFGSHGGAGGLATVSNSYWDTTTSGQATSAAGTGMTTADMQTQANFTSATAANGNVNPNWDFTNTWVAYDGHTSPLLRAFMTALTVTANNVTKTYDGSMGSNGVTYSVTPNGNLSGTVSYTSGINAGSYTITPSGLYSNQQGYIISYVGGTLTVNKADLTLGGTRIYDGSSAVAGSVLTATGVAGETFTVTGAGDASNLASKNVQAGSTLASVTGLTLGTSGNGGLSGNYNALSTTGSSVSITKADLTISGITAANKPYDGTTAATVDTSAAVYAGRITGDDVTVGATGVFSDQSAGNGKTVTLTSHYLGADSGNYAITDQATTTADITPVITTSNDGQTARVANAVTSAISTTSFMPVPPAHDMDAGREPASTQAAATPSPLIQSSNVPGSENLTGLNVTLVGSGIKLPSDVNGTDTRGRKK